MAPPDCVKNCEEIFRSTGFSLCGFNCGPLTVHRLKPVPQNRVNAAIIDFH
jgi:hypothetical protein